MHRRTMSRHCGSRSRNRPWKRPTTRSTRSQTPSAMTTRTPSGGCSSGRRVSVRVGIASVLGASLRDRREHFLEAGSDALDGAPPALRRHRVAGLIQPQIGNRSRLALPRWVSTSRRLEQGVHRQSGPRSRRLENENTVVSHTFPPHTEAILLLSTASPALQVQALMQNSEPTWSQRLIEPEERKVPERTPKFGYEIWR